MKLLLKKSFLNVLYVILQANSYCTIQNQVMTALTGPAVFHGTFYESVHTIGVRIEYLITGMNMQTAINMFIKSIYNDLLSMENAECPHVILGGWVV